MFCRKMFVAKNVRVLARSKLLVNRDRTQRLPLGRHGGDFGDFFDFVRALPLVPGL